MARQNLVKQLKKHYLSMWNRIRNNPLYKDKSVDYRWQSFKTFYMDMKDSYFEGCVLDRIDNFKGYSKENCQWLSKSDHAKKSFKENAPVADRIMKYNHINATKTENARTSLALNLIELGLQEPPRPARFT